MASSLVLLFQPEQVAHGLDRNEDARIGPVIAVLPHFAEHPDNFKADSIEQEGRADGRASGEYVLQKLPADDGHSSRFGIVLIVEPAPRADRNIADLVVFRRDSEDLAVGGTIIADGANVLAIEQDRKR